MTSYRVPRAAYDMVARDGLPRLVADELDPAVLHVLYLERDTVRSMLSTEWSGPLPDTPTPQQSADAASAREAAEAQDRADAATLRARVLSVAQGAVGQQLDTLTAVQVRALMAILLWQAGGLTRSGAVRPLSEWVRS